MEEQTEKLKFQYRNNDFLYRRKIFGGGIQIIDGTIKEYYFHIAKKSDYNIFYDDFSKLVEVKRKSLPMPIKEDNNF